MNKHILSSILLLSSLCTAYAQDGMFTELATMQRGVVDLSVEPQQNKADYDVFGKESRDVDLSDVVEKVQEGARLYTTGDSAILIPKGDEPILLTKGSDGGVEAFYFCRIVPVCAEEPEQN